MLLPMLAVLILIILFPKLFLALPRWWAPDFAE